MKKILFFWFCGISFLWASPEKDLAQGKIFTSLELVSHSRVKLGKSEGVVQGSLEEVWGIVTDYEHYKEFMPRTRKAEVKERTEKGVRFFTELNLPWPISDVSYECQVEFTEPPKAISFKIVPESGKGVKDFYGSWELIPFGENQKETLVKYTLLFEPSKNYPKWAINLGTEKSIKGVIRAIRERFKKLKKESPGA